MAGGVKWLPRAPRWQRPGHQTKRSRRERKDEGSVWDSFDIPIDFDGLAVVIVVIGLLVVAWFWLLPVAILVADIIFLVAVATFSVAMRVLRRRPWMIEATSKDTTVTWPVIGIGPTRRAIADISSQIESGLPLNSAQTFD